MSEPLVPVMGSKPDWPTPSRTDLLLCALEATALRPSRRPVRTPAIGEAGADGPALLAIQIQASERPELRLPLADYRQRRADKVLAERLP